jgi:hypothetical protein
MPPARTPDGERDTIIKRSKTIINEVLFCLLGKYQRRVRVGCEKMDTLRAGLQQPQVQLFAALKAAIDPDW